jgi:hypothetical protein
MIDTVMVQQEPVVSAIAHIIQLAVAPVFLLSGIGAILSVMTNRLSRVVDRARVLEGLPHIEGSATTSVAAELSTLAARAKLISHSITLCTTTALLICAVIVVLFLGAFVKIDTSTVVGLLFIAAMSAFFLALLVFLREISIATSNMRIGLERTKEVTAACSRMGDSLHLGRKIPNRACGCTFGDFAPTTRTAKAKKERRSVTPLRLS